MSSKRRRLDFEQHNQQTLWIKLWGMILQFSSSSWRMALRMATVNKTFWSALQTPDVISAITSYQSDDFAEGVCQVPKSPRWIKHVRVLNIDEYMYHLIVSVLETLGYSGAVKLPDRQPSFLNAYQLISDKKCTNVVNFILDGVCITCNVSPRILWQGNNKCGVCIMRCSQCFCFSMLPFLDRKCATCKMTLVCNKCKDRHDVFCPACDSDWD
jgi:hypothetical protein